MADLMKRFEDVPENKVFAYAVYRDSLVYMFKRRGHLRAGILESRNIAFGSMISWDTLYIDPDCKVYPLPVEATREDFAKYRVQVPPDCQFE